MAVLIPRSVGEAKAWRDAESRGEEAPYDPLGSAHAQISRHAFVLGGLSILMTDCCPLCEAMRLIDHGEVTSWIEETTDACFRYAKNRGLVSESSAPMSLST